MVVGLATLTNESLWTLTSVAVVKINTSGSVSAWRFQIHFELRKIHLRVLANT